MDSQTEKDAMSLIMQTNAVQGKALKILNPDNDSALELKMIFAFGHEWRIIINQFLSVQGTIPTEEDLIWCSSLKEHFGKDIRIIVAELKKG